MPPIYIGETPVTIYKGDVEISSLAVGEILVATYT